MTTITLTQTNPVEISTDLLVAYVNDEGASVATDTLDQAITELDPQTDAGATTVLPSCGTQARKVTLVGTETPTMLKTRRTSLDDGIEMSGTGRHRHYAAIGVRGAKATRVTLAGTYETFDEVVSAGVGALVGSYQFSDYRDSDAPGLDELVIVAPESIDEDEAVARIHALANAQMSIMDLVNRAPNDLYPETFVEYVADAVDGLPIAVEVWDEDRLHKENCGGILAVGAGSDRGPRLVKLTYAPDNAQRHISFVGKGITFDSGGLSLKPSDSMETMKSDMTGAATVLNATIAAAKLGLQVGITTYLALAENMPGGHAQRPSDVITIRNGMTVEVLNTDAEGRLVMADALALAAETDTDAIVDVATLTGAQMVGLGARTAGVMGTAEVRDVIVSCANEVGEAMWPAPLPLYLRESLKSNVADIANKGTRWGGMLVAGVFLQEFVADKPWAHLDIAGPSYNDEAAWGANAKGATGMSLLTLVEWVESLL
ncbi:MAG: leucyl aminopeptidase [Actinomycetaceae bacterium]|nr:leucyl aminopeptidase [Actinomycetaceae bacterium]